MCMCGEECQCVCLVHASTCASTCIVFYMCVYLYSVLYVCVLV